MLAVTVDARLCHTIGRHITMLIKMIGRQVQNDCGSGWHSATAFKLETRQLQHKNICIMIKQIKCRCAKISADRRRQSGCRQSLVEHRCHGALAVRACDRNDRCGTFADKQINVADDIQPTSARFTEYRRIQIKARRDNDLLDRWTHGGTLLTNLYACVRHRVQNCIHTRRFRTRIDKFGNDSSAGKKPGARCTRQSHAHDQHGGLDGNTARG